MREKLFVAAIQCLVLDGGNAFLAFGNIINKHGGTIDGNRRPEAPRCIHRINSIMVDRSLPFLFNIVVGIFQAQSDIFGMEWASFGRVL